MSSYSHTSRKFVFPFAFHYWIIALLALSLAFLAGYIAAQSRQPLSIAWTSGWAMLAKPASSPDLGIYGDVPLYDSIIREDIEIGFREDGVVVWRRTENTREDIIHAPQ
jgi:hypothetical protein